MSGFEKLHAETGAALGKLLLVVGLVGVAVLGVIPGKMLVATVAAQEKVNAAALQAFTGGVAERSDGLSLDTLTIAERFAGGEDHSVQLVMRNPTNPMEVCAYARWDAPGTWAKPRVVGNGCATGFDPIGFEGAVELEPNSPDGGGTVQR